MITLRDFTIEDTERLVEVLNDCEVTRFLSTKIPSPYTHSDAEWWILQGSKTGIVKAIEFNRQLIGCIGVAPGEFEYQRSGEIGYWLDRQYWHRGLMAAAIAQITKHVFSHTQMVRIFATVFADNIGSQKLLLKCGFESEAILRKAIYKHQQFYDAHIFATLKDKKFDQCEP